jgi:hypothetical protein
MSVTEEVKQKRALDEARECVTTLKRLSVDAKVAEDGRKEYSADVLPQLIELLGVNGKSIRFEFNGKELAAKVSQGDPGEKWDVAPLIEWLKENKLWKKSSAEQLDPDKLHALIMLGDIKKADVERFMLPIDPAKPSVKWVNADVESL